MSPQLFRLRISDEFKLVSKVTFSPVPRASANKVVVWSGLDSVVEEGVGSVCDDELWDGAVAEDGGVTRLGRAGHLDGLHVHGPFSAKVDGVSLNLQEESGNAHSTGFSLAAMMSLDLEEGQVSAEKRGGGLGERGGRKMGAHPFASLAIS